MNALLIEPTPHFAQLLRPFKSQVKLIASSGAGTAALRQAGECDLILVSAQQEENHLHELLARLRENARAPIVIVDVDETEAAILPLFEAGAIGYVPRQASAAEAFRILQAIQYGKSPLAPHIGTALVARMNELLALRRQKQSENTTLEPTGDNRLTPRETEVLQLMSLGHSNQEIAAQLMIELGTVKNHVHSILKKLGATSRVQAALCYANLASNVPPPSAAPRPLSDGDPSRSTVLPLTSS